MALTTVLVDNREQQPYEFDGYPVATEAVTLRTGDYTLEEFCNYDEDNDTYIPRLCIERKSGQDLLQSVTHDRDRFKDEIKRAKGWPAPMVVLIEEPWETFRDEKDFMMYRDVHPNQIEGTIDSWSNYYNVEFDFLSDRNECEREAFDRLVTWLRSGVIV